MERSNRTCVRVHVIEETEKAILFNYAMPTDSGYRWRNAQEWIPKSKCVKHPDATWKTMDRIWVVSKLADSWVDMCRKNGFDCEIIEDGLGPLVSISKLSALADVSPRALRYYEEEGFIESVREKKRSPRKYTEGMVTRARLVAHASKLGVPLGDIDRHLNRDTNVLVIPYEVLHGRIVENMTIKDGLDEKNANLARIMFGEEAQSGIACAGLQ